MDQFKVQYEERIKVVEEPHLFIYLRSSTDTIMDRIRRRGRDFEKSMDVDFIVNISRMYDEMFANFETKFSRSKVLIIETDYLNSDQVLNVAQEYILANYFEDMAKI